jgi:hypothetical protein
LKLVILSLAQTNTDALFPATDDAGAAAGTEEGPNDFTMKLLHLAWHPQANVIACAASNSLYLYCAP